MKNFFYNLAIVVCLGLMGTLATAQPTLPPNNSGIVFESIRVNDQPSPAQIELGGINQLMVYTDFLEPFDQIYWNVWIDFNGDGIYDQEELIIDEVRDPQSVNLFYLNLSQYEMLGLNVLNLKIIASPRRIQGPCDDTGESSQIILFYSNDPFTVNMGDGDCTCRYAFNSPEWPPASCHDINDTFNRMFLVRVMKEHNNYHNPFIEMRTFVEVNGQSILPPDICLEVPYILTPAQPTNEGEALDFYVNVTFDIPNWVNEGDVIDFRFEAHRVEYHEAETFYDYLDEVKLEHKICDNNGWPDFPITWQPVYPNPFQHQFTITQPLKLGVKINKVVIANAFGKTVMKAPFKPNNGFNKMDVSLKRLPRGVYYMTLSTNKGEKQVRLVKSR